MFLYFLLMKYVSSHSLKKKHQNYKLTIHLFYILYDYNIMIIG